MEDIVGGKSPRLQYIHKVIKDLRCSEVDSWSKTSCRSGSIQSIAMTEKRGIIHNGDVNLFNNNGAHVRWFILSFVVDYYDNFFFYMCKFSSTVNWKCGVTWFTHESATTQHIYWLFKKHIKRKICIDYNDNLELLWIICYTNRNILRNKQLQRSWSD